MKHFNRAAAILVCLFIVAAPFTRCFYSYADSTIDNWQSVTTNAELVEAFKYYCKSRDLTIEGSIADGVTSFTTQTFQNCCNAIGIDMNAIQAHIKKSTDGNNIRFLFDSTGITAYNQIFSQFLQDYELEVGDSVNDTVYDGRYVDENNSLIWVVSGDVKSSVLSSQNNLIMKGSYYMYDSAYCYNYSFNNGGSSYINVSLSNYSASILVKQNYIPSSNSYYYCLCLDNVDYIFHGSGTDNNGINRIGIEGFPIIVYDQSAAKMYIGGMVKQYYGNDIRYTIYKSTQLYGWGNYTEPININITTNNTVINNNTYEGDTIINQDGTPSQPDPPSGGTPPNWDLGGGEGTADDGNGNTWNITWPSFELPDLNIDWTINGLSEKFPFSIPFDLVSLVQVLSAEPEAPQFSGTIDLKVYQWNYDLDFSQFNSVAAVFRTAETLLFIFGLIMITRKIIRG